MDEVRYASKLFSSQGHASPRFYPSRFKVLIRLVADLQRSQSDGGFSPKAPLDGAVVEFLSEQPKYLCSAPEAYLSVEGAAHSFLRGSREQQRRCYMVEP